jgi:hypothetical protein
LKISAQKLNREYQGINREIAPDFSPNRWTNFRGEGLLGIRHTQAYLISLGIAASRLTVVGFEESMPAASNATIRGQDQNRRVELKPKY